MLKRAGLVLVGLACLLAIVPAAAPVQFAYVYSDSMEPTIGQSDGFVLVPAGAVTTGDVVTYWSTERDAYVTHRVVGETADGFLTKGDNNPTTDQSAGHAAVQRDAITGKVLTVAGTPVVGPGLGHGARFIERHRPLVVGLLGIVLLAALLHERSPARPSRPVLHVRGLLWPIFAIALVSAVGFQAAGGTTEELTYVAVESQVGGTNTITVGESRTDTVVIERSNLPLTTAVIGVEGMTITNETWNESTVTASLRVPPPTRTGEVTTEVHVNRYVTVLPPPLIRRLHALHPLLAAISTAAIAMSPIGLATLLVFDVKQPIRSVEGRLQRTLRRRWREL